MTTSSYTVGNYLDWIKEHPLNLDKPLCKKPKYMDEVWVSFTQGEARKGWVLALNGGDFENQIDQQQWGDQIKVFFPPVRGEHFYRGVKTWWLMDIGIGKTKAEAHASYCKHTWFKRSKKAINNDRFWAAMSKE